jgi:hypothetical protein
MRRSLGTGLVAVIATLILALPTKADTITNIDLSTFYNGDWSTATNGAAMAAGAESGSGNAGTGLTFSDPTGRYVGTSWDGIAFTFPKSITISSLAIALTSSSTINGLFNNFFGSTNKEGTVSVTNSNRRRALPACLRRRITPMPANAVPSSANELGSGTPVVGVAASTCSAVKIKSALIVSVSVIVIEVKLVPSQPAGSCNFWASSRELGDPGPLGSVPPVSVNHHNCAVTLPSTPGLLFEPLMVLTKPSLLWSRIVSPPISENVTVSLPTLAA